MATAIIPPYLMPICSGPELAGSGGEQLCTFCDFLVLGQNFLDWLSGLVVIVALGFIVYGGYLVLFDLGSSERVAQGRKAISSAVIGLVLFFAAWLIVNSIFQFLSGNFQALPWYQIQC